MEVDFRFTDPTQGDTFFKSVPIENAEVAFAQYSRAACVLGFEVNWFWICSDRTPIFNSPSWPETLQRIREERRKQAEADSVGAGWA